jgi:protein-tyrosine-phosphatase
MNADKSARPLTILFLCTGNSARSIFAEALTNHLAQTDGRFRAHSAGSHPRGGVHPLTLAVLREQRVPVEGLRSKSWDEFAGPGAPPIDVVITVCDQAAAEPCPLWPGHPLTAHWGVPDPAAAGGSDERKRRAFLEACLVLRRRIELLTGLFPADLAGAGGLDLSSQPGRLSLQRELQRIGHE